MAPLTLAELERVARGGAPAPLSADARARLVRGRETVDAMVAEGTVVYGVTTGFGDLSSVRIDAADAAQLQLNLVRSHAIGVGEPLPAEVVRGMLLLLANSLSKGHSGVRPELVALLLGLLEQDVLPVVPSRGSVGASRAISRRSRTSPSCSAARGAPASAARSWTAARRCGGPVSRPSSWPRRKASR